MLEASIQLARELALVGVARQFVGQTMTEWGLDPIRDKAVLIASALAANAVLHACTDFRVTLRSDGVGYLRIEVRNQHDRIPSPAPPLDATSGRGLAIVDALATSWEPGLKEQESWCGPQSVHGVLCTGEGLDLSNFRRRAQRGRPAPANTSLAARVLPRRLPPRRRATERERVGLEGIAQLRGAGSDQRSGVGVSRSISTSATLVLWAVATAGPMAP